MSSTVAKSPSVVAATAAADAGAAAAAMAARRARPVGWLVILVTSSK
jgi:hypothetical protein